MSRPEAQGFTLIELLVALAVFAVVAVMAYGGLDQVLSVRARAARAAHALGALQLTYQVCARDFTQVVPRGIRNAQGDPLPPFLTGTGTDLVEFTRGGWRNPAGQVRSSLQRVAYRIEKDRLVRRYWLVLDRAQDSVPVAEPLMAGVRSLRFRFLDRAGHWREDWPVPADATPPRLPRAVEMDLDTDRWGELRWLFVLP